MWARRSSSSTWRRRSVSSMQCATANCGRPSRRRPRRWSPRRAPRCRRRAGTAGRRTSRGSGPRPCRAAGPGTAGARPGGVQSASPRPSSSCGAVAPEQPGEGVVGAQQPAGPLALQPDHGHAVRGVVEGHPEVGSRWPRARAAPPRARTRPGWPPAAPRSRPCCVAQRPGPGLQVAQLAGGGPDPEHVPVRGAVAQGGRLVGRGHVDVGGVEQRHPVLDRRGPVQVLQARPGAASPPTSAAGRSRSPTPTTPAREGVGLLQPAVGAWRSSVGSVGGPGRGRGCVGAARGRGHGGCRRARARTPPAARRTSPSRRGPGGRPGMHRQGGRGPLEPAAYDDRVTPRVERR